MSWNNITILQFKKRQQVGLGSHDRKLTMDRGSQRSHLGKLDPWTWEKTTSTVDSDILQTWQPASGDQNGYEFTEDNQQEEINSV